MSLLSSMSFPIGSFNAVKMTFRDFSENLTKPFVRTGMMSWKLCTKEREREREIERGRERVSEKVKRKRSQKVRKNNTVNKKKH